MAVLINCLILCVWQFNSVQSGVNMPFTSITYKASPVNPRSLSLSFSTNDSMDSKITSNLEDFKPIKTSLLTQEEELSKKKSISKLISQLDLISDNDLTPTYYIFSKQKQNVDPNILYQVASPPQKYVPDLRTNINEKNDLPKDQQNKKNTVNYNIKVTSPPAVFNHLPIYLPVTQNVADSKIVSETNKYLENVPPTFLLTYPVRTTTEEDKQKSTEWQNGRKTFSNYEDGTKYKIVEPLVQRNIINIAEHDIHLMRNMAKIEDIIFPPKANAKCTYDLNIHKTPLNTDLQSNHLCDYNCHQISTKYLDTSNIQNHISTMSDIININQEIKPSVDALSTHATECFPKLSSSNLPEILKPQQIYTRDYNTYNTQLGTSLDNIVSLLKSKFILAISNNSATSLTTPALLSADLLPELLQPHITDTPRNLSETVFVSTYPEVESSTYLPTPKIDILQKVTNNATKKSITKSPIPYISSVTINYMPCIESSNEIMIFV